MRICVFGAGAVGGNMAARLAKGGQEVTVVARGAHAAAMRTDGLKLIATDGTFTVRPRVAADAVEAGPQDAVVMTLKAHALAAVAPSLGPMLGPDTPVVFAVNGIPWWYHKGDTGPCAGRSLPRLDPGGAVEAAVGLHRTVGCVIYSGNTVVAPGVVENAAGTNNRFVLGRPDGTSTPALDALSAAVSAAPGVSAPLVADLRRHVWEKLMANLSSSPIAALTGNTLSVTSADPALRAVRDRLIDEGMRVAAAAGWPVSDAFATKLRAPSDSTHKASMLQDVEAGRPIEYDAIVGAVLDMARDLGVPTPTLDVIAPLLAARGRNAAGG